MGIFSGRGSINVNGRTYRGTSITINNGKVIIDGKVQEEGLSGTVEVKVVEDIGSLTCDGSATVYGNVLGNVHAQNSVEVEGDVLGDVNAGNSVDAKSIKGNVRAGNSVYSSDSQMNMDTRRNWF